MKNEFIETANVDKFNAICDELTDQASLIGPSLAMVTGPAGRGKSEAARWYATQTDAIYIPPLNVRSPAMVLREITFELSAMKPVRSETCLGIIGGEMAKERRLIIIDEADLLTMQVLEMLRNLNERYACPVLLIGEDELKGRVASRRRIASRIRRRMEFGPVTQADVGLFFKRSLDTTLTPDAAALIHRHSNGDWRPILTTAIAVERAMKSSGVSEITSDLVKNVIKSNS
ncbi:MAG: AAA family ATPase [Deltaproteobacteria bacterium]|nr:AAA family ATPase [Deltaproteobacteria bacterium]